MAILLEPQEYTAFQEWKAVVQQDTKRMNQRADSRKSFSPIVIEAIHFFARMAIEIQLTNKATASMRIDGHIQSVDFEIYNAGWYVNADSDLHIKIYSFTDITLDEIKNTVREKVAAMDIFTPEHLEIIINQ